MLRLSTIISSIDARGVIALLAVVHLVIAKMPQTTSAITAAGDSALVSPLANPIDRNQQLFDHRGFAPQYGSGIVSFPYYPQFHQMDKKPAFDMLNGGTFGKRVPPQGINAIWAMPLGKRFDPLTGMTLGKKKRFDPLTGMTLGK